MNASIVGPPGLDGTVRSAFPTLRTPEADILAESAYNVYHRVGTRPREYGLGRSMPDVEITIRNNGPYSVSGPIKLVDADGNPVDTAGRERVSLCRCGGSTN